MSNPAKMDAWKKLTGYAKSISNKSIHPRDNHQIAMEHLSLNYGGQRISDHIIKLLLELAQESKLQQQIHALFSGMHVNNTEQRPALHTALRASATTKIYVNEQNVVPEVIQVRQQMKDISQKIRNGDWLGSTGKALTDVVNIGIGGSMLGPFFCIHALSDYVSNSLKFHFIAEIEPQAFSKVCTHLNPETTLFIISSKSFSTPETMLNMQKALAWMGQTQPSSAHFIAVTANSEQAKKLGFQHILPIWNWVGGRYSVCSSINLISCIAIGFEQFNALLQGARDMDQHFQHTDFSRNLPVILALLGIWNINFLHRNNLVVLTYADDLSYFVPYLQQLDMESNGKSINKQGQLIQYDTGPIIWGGSGNQAQHSYYQLLCQGTHKVSADLLSIKTLDNHAINKMCLGHRKVLIDGAAAEDSPHSYIPGEAAVNHISLTECSPKALGALIALYEHKVFVQGVIWNINSFDQPGVERSKEIFKHYF